MNPWMVPAASSNKAGLNKFPKMSTTKALPALCVLFLFFSSTLILPCTEAASSLEESKADVTVQPKPLDPSRNPAGRPYTSRGQPYTGRRCNPVHKCKPPEAKP